MSNKDIFSFNPFKREIDEQLDTPFNNAGIMSKDVSSDIDEAEDNTYDPFSFVDRFAKDLVSLFDENEEDKEKLQNTYMADTKSDRLAARDAVLDELVVDYNAAFERGRPLTEASTIETLPLPPIGEADPLRKTVRDALRSSDSDFLKGGGGRDTLMGGAGDSSSGVPVPQKTDPVLAGFMPFSDAAALDALSKVGGFLSRAVEAAQEAGQSVGDTYKALSSTPVAMMLDDVLIPAMGRKITEKNFSPEAIEILRKMAVDNKLKPGDSMKIDYGDFNKYGAELSARFVTGTNEDAQTIKQKLANLSPADEVKMTLGEAMIEVDDEGNIKVLDQYDFNSWAYFGKGKQKNGEYLSLSADEFEKSGISFNEAVMDTLQNSPSDYQMLRNLAFLFGSRDYEGTERDTGRKVEINLGNLGGAPRRAPAPRARPAGLMARTS